MAEGAEEVEGLEQAASTTTITVKRLVETRTIQDIESLLEECEAVESDWLPLGGTESNAANIETTKSRVAPIVERIVNGFDAALEMEMIRRGGSEAPPSPRRAVEKWFSIPGGDWSEFARTLTDEKRNELGGKFVVVTFADSLAERKPTIIVRDSGIGRHPSEFDSTLLRLGKSNKIRSTYLCGVYGHGGSSTYRFCPYTVIISRRQPDILGKGQGDLIGWTIVRQNRHRQDLKTTVYEYYAPQGKIPSLDASTQFLPGTCVIHVSYDGQRIAAPLSLEGYKSFRHFLFNPILPFKIEDLRNKPHFRRNMFGARAVLVSDEKGLVRYENRATLRLDGHGEIRLRYWVLKINETDPSKLYLDGYLDAGSPACTMPVTLNGQRHGAFERSLLKEARLSLLQKYLLVQIEIDDLSRDMKAGLFTSNREGLVEEGEEVERLRDEVINALKDDDALQHIEKEIFDITRQHADQEAAQRARQMLDQLISIGRNRGLGQATASTAAGVTEGPADEFSPADPPTYVRIITRQDPLEVPRGGGRIITIETDGPDNMFRRRERQARLSVVFSSDAGLQASYDPRRDFKDGKLRVTLTASSQTPDYSSADVQIALDMEGLAEPLRDARACSVTPPPTPYVPCDPPTTFELLTRRDPIPVHKTGKTRITLGLNGPDDLFERQGNQGQFNACSSSETVRIIRIVGPKSGQMRIVLQTDGSLEDGYRFEFSAQVALADGRTMQVNRACEIVPILPPDDEEQTRGRQRPAPNYELIPVHRQDWAVHQWNETDVGKHALTTDNDGHDKLCLYINMDNEHIIEEIQRRRGISQGEEALKLVADKYLSYIGYHVFLQYEDEQARLASDPTQQRESTQTPRVSMEGYYEVELKRVTQTLVLSFRGARGLDSD